MLWHNDRLLPIPSSQRLIILSTVPSSQKVGYPVNCAKQSKVGYPVNCVIYWHRKSAFTTQGTESHRQDIVGK